MLALLALLSGAHASEASSAAERDFECVQVTITDPGTELAVSGTIIPRRARPTDVIVSNARSGQVLVERTDPRLTNSYDLGYWLTNYGLNTWAIGRYSTTSYMFLVPRGTLGTVFEAQLHEIFGPHGTWGWYPLEMDCELL